MFVYFYLWAMCRQYTSCKNSFPIDKNQLRFTFYALVLISINKTRLFDYFRLKMFTCTEIVRTFALSKGKKIFRITLMILAVVAVMIAQAVNVNNKLNFKK